MKKYDSYKDSGIEWIGEIPSHWCSTKVKYVFYTQKGKTPKVLLDSFVENSNVYLSMDFLRGEPKQTFYVSSEESVIITDDNETLLLWDGSNAGEFIKSKYGVLSSTMALIQSSSINRSFQWFFFKSFEPLLKDSCNGMGIPHVDGKFFRGSIFLIPPETEQTAIANYLDHKTSQIDHLIAKKEQFIKLLEEERVAVINQAVTKGLDPNVPMKDSGVEWLGEIPEHWERARIKTLVSIKVCDGPHETPEWKEDGVPFISAEAIKGNQIDLNYKRGFISEEQHLEYCKKSKVQKGDILFCKSGSTTGKSALVEIDDEFGIWSPLAIIRVNEKRISNRFMFQSIQSSLFKNQVETSWTFGTQPNIGMGALENLWIAIPPLNEQVLIDEYLRTEINKFENIILKTFQEVDLLKEYKTALISEVVTGKVDVSTSSTQV